jgi:hypothetical protein
MPWCDTCDEYRAPNSLKADGHCASCDSEVDVADLKEPAPVKAPWHFWLMVIALVIYLGWRMVEGVVWIFDKI